ncbi:uncharacterized protein LOC108674435, partial [Hyalella azteca]|uniref:Uncharacterized protein LOC108674435 n=1 Tax=Hyalella azteca TaxID=294128 RepID=A0A8B7NYB4_HYAAZ
MPVGDVGITLIVVLGLTFLVPCLALNCIGSNEVLQFCQSYNAQCGGQGDFQVSKYLDEDIYSHKDATTPNTFFAAKDVIIINAGGTSEFPMRELLSGVIAENSDEDLKLGRLTSVLELLISSFKEIYAGEITGKQSNQCINCEKYLPLWTKIKDDYENIIGTRFEGEKPQVFIHTEPPNHSKLVSSYGPRSSRPIFKDVQTISGLEKKFNLVTDIKPVVSPVENRQVASTSTSAHVVIPKVEFGYSIHRPKIVINETQIPASGNNVTNPNFLIPNITIPSLPSSYVSFSDKSTTKPQELSPRRSYLLDNLLGPTIKPINLSFSGSSAGKAPAKMIVTSDIAPENFKRLPQHVQAISNDPARVVVDDIDYAIYEVPLGDITKPEGVRGPFSSMPFAPKHVVEPFPYIPKNNHDVLVEVIEIPIEIETPLSQDGSYPQILSEKSYPTRTGFNRFNLHQPTTGAESPFPSIYKYVSANRLDSGIKNIDDQFIISDDLNLHYKVENPQRNNRVPLQLNFRAQPPSQSNGSSLFDAGSNIFHRSPVSFVTEKEQIAIPSFTNLPSLTYEIDRRVHDIESTNGLQSWLDFSRHPVLLAQHISQKKVAFPLENSSISRDWHRFQTNINREFKSPTLESKNSKLESKTDEITSWEELMVSLNQKPPQEVESDTYFDYYDDENDLNALSWGKSDLFNNGYAIDQIRNNSFDHFGSVIPLYFDISTPSSYDLTDYGADELGEGQSINEGSHIDDYMELLVPESEPTDLLKEQVSPSYVYDDYIYPMDPQTELTRATEVQNSLLGDQLHYSDQQNVPKENSFPIFPERLRLDSLPSSAGEEGFYSEYSETKHDYGSLPEGNEYDSAYPDYAFDSSGKEKIPNVSKLVNFPVSSSGANSIRNYVEQAGLSGTVKQQAGSTDGGQNLNYFGSEDSWGKMNGDLPFSADYYKDYISSEVTDRQWTLGFGSYLPTPKMEEVVKAEGFSVNSFGNQHLLNSFHDQRLIVLSSYDDEALTSMDDVGDNDYYDMVYPSEDNGLSAALNSNANLKRENNGKSIFNPFAPITKSRLSRSLRSFNPPQLCTYQNTGCETYCDGFWVVIQDRDWQTSRSFDKKLSDFRIGFGDASSGYWIGLECLHFLTSRRPHQLLVELVARDGRTASALYENFSVDGGENFFQLHLGRFVEGDAGDGFRLADGALFST